MIQATFIDMRNPGGSSTAVATGPSLYSLSFVLTPPPLVPLPKKQDTLKAVLLSRSHSTVPSTPPKASPALLQWDEAVADAVATDLTLSLVELFRQTATPAAWASIRAELGVVEGHEKNGEFLNAALRPAAGLSEMEAVGDARDFPGDKQAVAAAGEDFFVSASAAIEKARALSGDEGSIGIMPQEAAVVAGDSEGVLEGGGEGGMADVTEGAPVFGADCVGGEGGGGEDFLQIGSAWVNIVLTAVCVVCAGLAAGLTMGLVSIEPLEMAIKQRSGKRLSLGGGTGAVVIRADVVSSCETLRENMICFCFCRVSGGGERGLGALRY